MENLLNQLEEKYLNFKLGEEQRDVLLRVFTILLNPEFATCVISGRAGVGKTTVIELLIHFIEDTLKKNYRLVAPTHKAKRILQEKTQRTGETIHQLLALKANVDILEFDLNDLQFSASGRNDVPDNGIIIVDECSMINDKLYQCLYESCAERNCKIVWVGDEKQLYSVKQKHVSKPFDLDNKFTLTKVYRQDDASPILDILEILRSKPLYDFKEVLSDKGSLLIYRSWQDLLDKNIHLFEKAINEKDPTQIKLLAYTNKRIEAFNQVIRKKLFGDCAEYVIGDFLMGYDSTCYKANSRVEYCIDNANDYRILEVEKGTKELGEYILPGYYLTVYDYDRDMTFTLFMLSRNVSESLLANIAHTIEYLRLKAVNCNNYSLKKKCWIDYFNFSQSFCTPFDLYCENKLVKKKTFDYGYCLSIHKSQASSIDNILLDMSNCYICQDPIELRQLQYVGMSRSRKDIHMLLK